MFCCSMEANKKLRIFHPEVQESGGETFLSLSIEEFSKFISKSHDDRLLNFHSVERETHFPSFTYLIA